MKIILKKNDANYCRVKGWVPGTVLVVARDTRYAGQQMKCEIKITAVGDEAILVRRIYRNRPHARDKEIAEEKWVQHLVKLEIAGVTLPVSKEERTTR